jgi:hypothetical protein
MSFSKSQQETAFLSNPDVIDSVRGLAVNVDEYQESRRYARGGVSNQSGSTDLSIVAKIVLGICVIARLNIHDTITNEETLSGWFGLQVRRTPDEGLTSLLSSSSVAARQFIVCGEVLSELILS